MESRAWSHVAPCRHPHTMCIESASSTLSAPVPTNHASRSHPVLYSIMHCGKKMFWDSLCVYCADCNTGSMATGKDGKGGSGPKRGYCNRCSAEHGILITIQECESSGVTHKPYPEDKKGYQRERRQPTVGQ